MTYMGPVFCPSKLPLIDWFVFRHVVLISSSLLVCNILL